MRCAILFAAMLLASCYQSAPGIITITGAPDSSGVDVREHRDDHSYQLTTDESGRYFFPGEPGLITVTAPFTLEKTKTWSSKYTEVPFPSFDFTAAGDVRGRVTLDGRADGNAGVRITMDDRETFSDEVGVYSISTMPLGTYPMHFVAVGYHEHVATVQVKYRTIVEIPEVDLVPD